MARGQKTRQKELTPEERLQNALVPKEEWPYELPEGWRWYYWGGIGDFIAGNAFKNIYQGHTDLPIPFYKVGSLKYSDDTGYLYDESNTIDENLNKKIKATVVPSDAIIFAKIGEAIRLNRRSMNRIPCCIDNNLMAFISSEKVDYRFVYYWTLGLDLYKYTNATTVPAIRKSDLERIPFPLTSMENQKKIIKVLDKEFHRLDEAKDQIQSVLDSSEERKQSILHKAFTGELTEKWRKENGHSLDEWRIIKLQDYCEKITCGKTPKDDIAAEGDIPYLKVYNIVNNSVDFDSKPQFIPREVHEGKLNSSRLRPHDVIMNIVGPPLRKIAIVPEDYPEWNMNQAIVRFRPKNGLDYQYLYYALVNPETLDSVIQQTKGVVGQANISVTQSRNLTIPLPSLQEQMEVVKYVEQLLNREADVVEVIEESVEEINEMKKAILSKAFRGELLS